ncbi:MAG: threonine/serine dehydratase [Acidobacteria bacterium]|nr:threonine/serine dehydratase [Acidobacteriota bacterium]
MDAAKIWQARDRSRGVFRVTPLLPSSVHTELWFKAENLQVTGSFKFRAAFNEISCLSAQEKERGVVTSSSGNFGLAVAYVAHMLGLSAKIVMMRSANPEKVRRTQKWGGEVVFCEDRFEARGERTAEIAAAEGRTIIFPYDHPEVVAGNATIALELIEQFPEVRNVVVPVSGGGLIGGIAVGAHAVNGSIKIWGVQPEGSSAACQSFHQKKIISIPQTSTIADGLKVTRPGSFTFPLIEEHVHDFVLVREGSIVDAVLFLLNEEKIVVEPSGAVPLAAALEGKVPFDKTVLILSGGNLDLRDWATRG